MGGQLRDMPSWHSAASSNRELDSLYKLVRCEVDALAPACMMVNCHFSIVAFHVQVEQLSRDVHRQQGVTISMASNKG